MGTPPTDLFVRETCVPIPKDQCLANNHQYQFMIDPCSCAHYYNCNDYNVLRQACADGTALNHITGICEHSDSVFFKGICNDASPWTRCNVTGQQLSDVIKRCGGDVTTPVTTEGTQTPSMPKENHTGLIVGSIIAGIFLIAFLVLFYLVWKKKIPIFRQKEESQPVQNPEYFNKIENIYEDHYAEITDVQEKSSENGPSLPKRPLTNQSSKSTENPDDAVNGRKVSNDSVGYMEPVQTIKRNEFVYDNSGQLVREESGDAPTQETNPKPYIDILDNNNTPSSHTDTHTELSKDDLDKSDYFILSKE